MQQRFSQAPMAHKSLECSGELETAYSDDIGGIIPEEKQKAS